MRWINRCSRSSRISVHVRRNTQSSPIEGIVGVEAGARYFYLDKSGRYLFTGQLIDLESGANLTEARLGKTRKKQMATFSDNDKVIFPAKEEEKGVLDIFTDTTCPYCRKLHSEVPKLQAAGVTVRYLPFPRSGPQGRGYDEMRSVWCAEDSAAEMTIAKSGSSYEVGITDCEAAAAVDAGYRLGVRVGVNGTPAIILPDGRMQPGYRPYNDLIEILGIN